MGLGKRKAIYISFPQAVPLKYTMDRRGTSPCTATCPSTAMSRAMWPSSPKASSKRPFNGEGETPLPRILAYACAHPCERECKRIEEDRPISICHLKRFLVDHVEEPEFEFTPPEEKGKKIAIVAEALGLTAAYDLRKWATALPFLNPKTSWAVSSPRISFLSSPQGGGGKGSRRHR